MLSIIIPTLDEAKTIGKTLAQVQKLQGEYEVLVVDGNSSDATRKIAAHTGTKVIKSERGIAKQLQTGVENAQGDAFLFLHADCALPENALEQLENCEAAGFKQQYDSFNIAANMQGFLNNTNAQLFSRFSGEQAFFLTKKSLLAAGGIPEVHTFETETLCHELKKANVPVQLLPGPVRSNSRRFKKKPFSILSINWAHALHDVGASDYKLKKHFEKAR